MRCALGSTLLLIPGLLVPLPVAAGQWGEDWGTMIWGSAPGVPGLEGAGLVLLACALVAGTWRVRRQSVALNALLVALAVPLTVGALVPYSLSDGAIADPAQVNANFASLVVDANASLVLPHVFTNGQIADANQVNENFSAIKLASAAPFSVLDFPYVFTNGAPAEAEEVNANFNARDNYSQCVGFHTFPTTSLPKSSNANFQWKGWKTGCMHGFQLQTVAECKAACGAPDGCCGGGGGVGYPVCLSNSCSGGGCCAASRQICRAACEVSHPAG